MTTTSVSALDGLRVRVLRGLAWKTVSQIFLQVSRIVVALLLARLLAPHDYGLAGMVTVFAGFVLVFSDLALGSALVQRRTVSDADRSTVFWTSVGAGLTFSLLGVGLSWPVALFYGEPAVKPLLAVLSLSFVITSLGTTHSALLNREMNFRSLELRLMAGTLAGAVVGVTVAVLGYGAWAIIAQQLATASMSTAMLWLLSDWRPSFAYSRASIRDLGSFSANVFGQRVLYYTTSSADSILIGRFLGPAAVGAYTLGFNVILVPLSRLGVPVAEVLFPALSRMQDDRERVAATWLRVNRIVSAISIPALLGLVVVADDFVSVLLGDRWHAATPVIQVLAWVGVLQAVQTLNGEVLLALDRSRTLFRFMILWSGANITAFAVGLQWGVVGVAAAFAISSTLVAPVSIALSGRAAHVSWRTFARNLWGVTQASVLAIGLVLAARLLLVAAGVPAAGRLGILVVLGVALYLPIVAWRMPDEVAEFRSLLRRRAAA